MLLVKTLLLLIGVIGVVCGIRLSLPTPITTASDAREAVAARVGNRPITVGELEQAAALRLYQADQQRHMILQTTLQDMIDDELLKTAASREGITVPELLGRSSQSPDIARLANIPAPKNHLRTTPDLAPQPASADLHQPARIRQALLVSLRRDVPIHITLPQPTPPIIPVSTDDDPSRGPADAPVTIVEFSDFQCPYCKKSASILNQLLEHYPDTLRVIYRDYPGPNHLSALEAAEAAQCAGDQGRFWDYHDLLFDRQVAGSGWDFAALAADLKLDRAAFTACLEGRHYREEVLKDLRDGLSLGIASTPTFFINGRPLVGARPFTDFTALIDPLLSQ